MPRAAAATLAALGLLLHAPSVRADCAEQAAGTVQAYYETVKDFSAAFEQRTHSTLFGSAGTELAAPAKGRVIFAKPGKMRWTYAEPEPSLVVSDGKTLWIYSPALQEVQRLAVTDGYLSGAALQFLLGEGKLLESFRVSSPSCPAETESAAKKSQPKAAPGQPGTSPTIELVLVPREATTYQRLGITARLDTGEVVATRVVDLLGNETEISFAETQINSHPSPDTFTFVPGPGVEVIDVQPQS